MGSRSTSRRPTIRQRQAATTSAQSLTGQSIPEGSSSYAFDVTVNGDTDVEFGEQFTVNLTNVTGAPVMDAQGIGTITNDDCGEPFTPIPSIQGSGSDAALTGLRATQGVVVGDFEGAAAAGGFFIQDPDRGRRPDDFGRHLRLHWHCEHRERRRPRARRGLCA